MLTVNNAKRGYVAEHSVCEAAPGRGQGQVIPAGQEALLQQYETVERASGTCEPGLHCGHRMDPAGAHVGELSLPMADTCALVYNPNTPQCQGDLGQERPDLFVQGSYGSSFLGW